MKGKLADDKGSLIPQIISEIKEHDRGNFGSACSATVSSASFHSELDSKFQLAQLFSCPIYPELGLAKRPSR